MNELPGWFLSGRHRPRRAHSRLAARVDVGSPDEVAKRARRAAEAGFSWVEIRCKTGDEADTLNAACMAARAAGAPAIAANIGVDPLVTSDVEFRAFCEASTGIQWIVISSGRPAGNVATPVERGRVFEALDRWRDTARESGMSLAVLGAPDLILGTTVACERFAQDRWGRGTALALDPSRWLASEDDDERQVLDLLLGLAPWSQVLYLGRESDTGVRTEPAVRALRAAGVPPCIVLYGDDIGAVRDETKSVFEKLGLPLDGTEDTGG